MHAEYSNSYYKSCNKNDQDTKFTIKNQYLKYCVFGESKLPNLQVRSYAENSH